MIKDIKIRQIHNDTLTCEPILRRAANGELLCICQCDGPDEPHPENRVYAFHSKDNGETWSGKENIYPENGRAVYCTEVSVEGDEITAYLTVHSGRFLDWDCVMIKSFDNGYTWADYGPPPHLPYYTFIRGTIHTSSGDIVIPYQFYPNVKEDEERIKNDPEIKDKACWKTKDPHSQSGVLISSDNGKTFERYIAADFEGFVWPEPTVVELSDGRLAMLLRWDMTGYLWYTESDDGGKTWSNYVKTDIPNPPNKPKLIKIGDKIALIHTPINSIKEDGTVEWSQRKRYEIWISDDDMKTWKYKKELCNFPGTYHYTDGFYEDGHILFSVEYDRKKVLFFDVELDA